MAKIVISIFLVVIGLIAYGQDKKICASLSSPAALAANNCLLRFSDYSSSDQLDIIYSLNKQGRHREALALIHEIPSPSSAILLEKARAQKALGLSTQAISTYKKVLKVNPDWDVARMELATLYKKQGQKKQALSEYNRLLDSELPYPLRQNLLSSQQELLQQKQNWYLNFLLNSYYDANINKAPNQGAIYIQGYRFDFDDPIGAYILAPEVKAGYQWDLSPKWLWQIHGAAVLQKPVWSQEKIDNQYDKLSLQLQTGPIYKISHNQLASLQFYGRQNYQNWQTESQILGMQAVYSHSFAPFSFYLSHDFSVEDYVFDDYDAHHHRSGLNFLYKNKNNQWNLGLQYIFHEAQNDIHSYQSPMISLIWEDKYKYNLHSTLSGFYAFYQYEGYSELFQSTRKDHEVGLFWDIAKTDWQVFHITPHIKYGYISTYSNQDVFEKNQHIFSIYGHIDF